MYTHAQVVDYILTISASLVRSVDTLIAGSVPCLVQCSLVLPHHWSANCHRSLSPETSFRMNTPGTTAGPMDWFNGLPKMSRSFAGCLVVTAACVSWGVSFPFMLFLDWRSVFRGQVRTRRFNLFQQGRPTGPCGNHQNQAYCAWVSWNHPSPTLHDVSE